MLTKERKDVACFAFKWMQVYVPCTLVLTGTGSGMLSVVDPCAISFKLPIVINRTLYENLTTGDPLIKLW